MSSTPQIKTNLVVNSSVQSTSTFDATDAELVLLTQIAYPFFNQFRLLTLQQPSYVWQDFILHCYYECFVPLHYDPSTRPVVCNRIAQLLWLGKNQPTKEHYSWIQLYSPYLALVPFKILHCKEYSTEERDILNHPSFWKQVLVTQPQPKTKVEPISLSLPPPAMKKTVRFELQQQQRVIKITKPPATRKRRRETTEENEEEDDDDYDEQLGRQLALADACVNKAVSVYNMAIGYCEELHKKVEYYKQFTLPQKLRELERFKKQRSELMERINKRTQEPVVSSQ